MIVRLSSIKRSLLSSLIETSAQILLDRSLKLLQENTLIKTNIFNKNMKRLRMLKLRSASRFLKILRGIFHQLGNKWTKN